MSRSAELDALTELPNRVLLLDRFAHAIASAKRHGTRLALLFLDLNNFKQINDTLGHAVGDQVLKLAAHRLASSVREADTVSRHGGDEFLILLAEVAQASDAVAHRRQADRGARCAEPRGRSCAAPDGEHRHQHLPRRRRGCRHAHRSSGRRHVPRQAARAAAASSFTARSLRASAARSRAALESLQRPLTHYELAQAEHERRYAQLREANEQLVLAALTAQELQAAAEQAHAAADGVPGGGGARAAQPADAHPHRGATAGRGSARTSRCCAGCRPSSSGRWSTCRGWWATCSTYRASAPASCRLERQVVDMAAIIDQAVDACRPAMDTRLQHFGVHVPSCAARSARRPGPPGADPQQPARQRVQVHARSAARSGFRWWWPTMPS